MNEHLTTLNLEGCDPLHPTSGLSVATQRILPSNTDPLTLASRVAERIHLGVRSMIEACILINEGVKYFEADREMLDQFRKALVNAHVIPSRSARLGDVDKSKLSMLRKIGEYADLLLEEKLFKFLEPGRSILYHVIRLHELLLGDHQDRIARLVELFEAQGSLTRGFLIDQINLAKRASEADNNQVADPWASAASDQDFDCIVATLADRRDVRRLAEDYPDRSPLCLRIHERVAKNAVGFFLARIADLPVIENKLLPGCGFSGMSRVFLVHGPLDADSKMRSIRSRGRKSSLNMTDTRRRRKTLPCEKTSHVRRLCRRPVRRRCRVRQVEGGVGAGGRSLEWSMGSRVWQRYRKHDHFGPDFHPLI